MKKHIKVYKEYFNIGEQDIIYCEKCGSNQGCDIHHIEYKSHCGNDEINNLICLCRIDHQKAHFQLKPYITKEELFEIIKNRKKRN